MKRLLLITLLATLPASVATAGISEPAMVRKTVGNDITWQHGETSTSPGVQSLLASGDVIRVGKGSFVEVEYLADGCMLRIEAGGSVVVSEASPCAAARQSAQKVLPQDAKVLPAAAGAVEISDKSGPLTQVNKGQGLVQASVGDALKVGDEVFAGAKSTVTLYFAASNCTYTVPAGNYLRISEQAPCKAPAAAQNGEPAPLPEGVTPALLLGAGALVAGGAAVAIISNQDDNNNNNNPATPN